MTQPSLIKFELEYVVADVNHSREGDSQLPAASIKDCMYVTTVHNLFIMGDIEGADSVEQATVQMVQIWFDAASSSAPLDLSDFVSSVITSVR